MADEKPTYTKYRSRPKLFGRGSGNGVRDRLDDLRGGVAPPRGARTSSALARSLHVLARRSATSRAAIAGWLLLSLLLFLVSAQIQRQGVTTPPAARSAAPATR